MRRNSEPDATFRGLSSPKTKSDENFAHAQKTPFERQSKAIRTVFCIRPAPPHSPKYPPSNRDACARSS